MCMDPVTLVTVGLSIGQAAVGYMDAKQQAKDQNAYYEANRQASLAAARDEYAHHNNKIIQESNAAAQEKFQKSIEAAKARATAATSAGEAGITGLSVDALLGDIRAQEGRQLNAIGQNYQMSKEAILAGMDNVQNQTTARINSVRRASKPSVLPFVIQGAAGALNATSHYLEDK